MDEVRICMICGRNLSSRNCPKCGILVCDKCFSRAKNLCTNCIFGRS